MDTGEIQVGSGLGIRDEILSTTNTSVVTVQAPMVTTWTGCVVEWMWC